MRATSRFAFVLVFSFTAHRAEASPLSDAAAALAAGEWIELTTADATALGFGPHTGNAIPYSQSAAWDPVTDTLHYIGKDHGPGNMFYFRFSAETNTWTNMGESPFAGHGYEHTAIDVAGRRLYHRVYSLGAGPESRRILGTAVDGATSWTEIEPFPETYAQVAIAILHVPDLGLVVYNCGEENGMIGIMDSSGSWRAIRGFGGSSRYSCFAEYSPALDVVVLGGGGGDDRRVWRMDRDGTVVELATSPLSLGTSYAGSGHQANVAADPNSGELLAIGEGQFWSLDPRDGGTWRRLPDPSVEGIHANDMISAPITDHGVVYFLACQIGNCRSYLYRHAPGSGMEVDVDAGVHVGPDGGAPAADAGSPRGDDAARDDAGRSPSDGGTDPLADPPDSVSGGCTCAASGAEFAAMWPLLAFIVFRRR